MQNIHLINSYKRSLNEFLHQPNHLPSITSLYGPDCKLLFPDIQNEPISIFFSEYLNHYLIFYEDDIFVDDESVPYFSLPFHINFACLSKSGDIAILVSGTFPNDVYIFDVDSKDLTKYEFNKETNNFEVSSNNNNENQHICNNDTDDTDDPDNGHHQCNAQSCQCNQKTRLQSNDPLREEVVTHASFRNDNKFAAISTKSYVHTLSSLIPDQQGRYDYEVHDPCGVTWNPQGSWLAFGNKNQIIFVEKNCRLRQIYELDDKESTLIALSWSPHRDILAYMDNRQQIVILSMKNRVIYRKYTIKLPTSEESFIPQIFWSKVPDDLSLAVIDRVSGSVFVYEFNYSVDKNENSIFVINGNTLCISDWSRSLIPPPLSHRKINFGETTNQITAITSNNEEVAVFTLDSVHLLTRNIEIPLQNASPVQCATFVRNNKDMIAFASNNTIYSLSLTTSPASFSVNYNFEDSSVFVSFLTPSFVVTSRSIISPLYSPGTKTGTISSPITEYVQSNNESANSENSSSDCISFCSREGKLLLNGNKIADNVKSFLFDEKLLAYVYISTSDEDMKLGSAGWMCRIQYGLESTSRQIEPLAELLFFSKRIFSIITIMNRGNIETNAPHVIVEAHLRNLIKDNQYAEAWRLSKKYQIPFSRYIDLGDIALDILCEQIPDTQLRSCMSVLRPLEKDSNSQISSTSKQLSFVLSFLSFVLGVNVEYENKHLIVPPYDPQRQEMAIFGTTCCICFVLLDSAVEAVRFSCCFNSSDLVKQCITFLLTLYDNNSLYDISLKTYDTKCIASVGLITMKEPSLYVPFIEELDSTANENLKKAKIDEAASDPESAVIHYALAGPEFDEKALYIIGRDCLFDVGLSSYPENGETWLKIIEMKLKYLMGLNKKEKEKSEPEIARTAIRSNIPGIIISHIQEIVRSGMWQIAIPCLLQNENGDGSALISVKEALENAKLLKEAALFTAQYIPSQKQEAARLFLQSHEWYQAIENGANAAETALLAFDTLKNEANRKAENARSLKARFEEVKEKQKIHKDSNIRHGKNKEKRGLPAIVVQLSSMLPDEKKTAEFQQVGDLLKMIGEDEKFEDLRRAFRDMVRAIFPIPRLPENEEFPIPSHLQGIL